MSSSRTWYPRFGDIPGIDWPCPEGIDRTALRGHDARPQDNEWARDSDSMWWPIIYERDRDEGVSVGITWNIDLGANREDDDGFDDDDDGGSTGESPASQYPGFTGPRSKEDELRRLYEALELPGTPEDYLHLISGSAEYLHKIRRRDPSAITDCERLCHLSLDVARACPEVLVRERRFADEDDFPVWVPGVHLLIRMHEDNGDLAEAEQTAVMAQQELGQRVEHVLGKLRERLAVLRSEDD